MNLELQRCTTCEGVQAPSRSICTTCGGTRLATVAASGAATVYSYTVVRRAPRPGIAVPYVVAVVRLAEGPAMLTHVVDCPPDDLRCGLEVALTWRTGSDGDPLAVFAPASTDPAPLAAGP